MSIFDDFVSAAEAILEGVQGTYAQGVSSTPRMSFGTGAGGSVIEIPLAPGGITITGPVASFSEVARPGRTPLLIGGGGLSLAVCNIDLRFVDPNPKVSVDKAITALRVLAQQGKKVTIAHGPQLQGVWWRITALSVTIDDDPSVAYVPGSLSTARGTMSITLTQDSTAQTSTGPTTGGYKTTVPADAPSDTPAYGSNIGGFSPDDVRRSKNASEEIVLGNESGPITNGSVKTILKGTQSLAKIAALNGTTVAKVMNTNGITRPGLLAPDDRIFVGPQTTETVSTYVPPWSAAVRGHN